MKTLKKILIGIVVLIGLLLVISFFMPSKFKLERNIVIKSNAEHVYAQINNLQSWVAWNPWQNADSSMKLTYFGPVEGIGATQKWTSEDGDGKLTIIETIPNQIIVYQFQFEDYTPMDARFVIEQQADSTVKLTWSTESDCGNNPIKKYFGAMMGVMMAKDYETGLANIKTVSEK